MGFQPKSYRIAPPVYFEVDYTLLGECVTGCGSVTFMYNGSEVTYGTVTGANEHCWLDRNPGAAQEAETGTDAEDYGDYFRFDDAVNACPGDFRLATEAEWEAEIASWESEDSAGAFKSPLKLPVAGYRSSESNGWIIGNRYNGHYCSDTVVDGSRSRSLHFDISSASLDSDFRASGLSVRCLKEVTSD